MNLEFGSEYDEFTNEVEEFCKEYSGAVITSNDKKFEMHDALSGNSSRKSGKSVGSCLLYTSPSPRDGW